MTARIKILSALVFLTPAMLFAAGEMYRPATVTPPEPPREFRGAWITEVAANPDWPSKPGLPAEQQKAELIALLDRAAELKLNAVILQVRPACDAIYASPIEPWSAHLTGKMGQPPQPFYDPLAFAVAEAHKRGLECTRGSIRSARCMPEDKSLRRAESYFKDAPGTHPPIRRSGLARPRRIRRARIRPARGHGRGGALRRGWRAVRRLFLSLPGKGCRGPHAGFSR